MSNSECPLCGKEAELTKVAEDWLIEEIGKEHPEWVTTDGVYDLCITYYRGLHDAVQVDRPDS